jgi:thymidine kinase
VPAGVLGVLGLAALLRVAVFVAAVGSPGRFWSPDDREYIPIANHLHDSYLTGSGHFFDLGIVDAIGALIEDGARVVAAGLAQDFRGLPFGAMPTLLCVAEFVDKLEAVCHRCGGPATMTQRLVDGQPAPFGGERIQVGALDSYEARCRACFQPGVDAALIAHTG